MRAFLITQLGPTSTASSSTTLPSNTQLTSMNTSRPQTSSPRTSKRAGSASRTPASISCSAALRCATRSSSASCTLLLTPSTSHSCFGLAVWIGKPSATAMPTMSVR
jgi:hypothetical protein